MKAMAEHPSSEGVVVEVHYPLVAVADLLVSEDGESCTTK
jgi:hypothetical protein